ncbi:MAG TPA: sugar ABC transporter substrate-binding protein [Chloroflexia bacterium]|nr:sugar ABC transporter substrate-binding protein [Chloroflexia bacterium]
MNQSENANSPKIFSENFSRNSLHRRTFVKRMLALGLGGSAALGLLAACGDNTATTASSNTSGGTTTTAASSSGSATTLASSDKQVTLTIWDYWQDQRVGYLGLLDSYQKANPNIKFQRSYVPFADLKQKLLLGSAAGQLPDIVLIDNPDHSAFADAGILADITSYITAWGQGNQYQEGPWKSTVWKGKNYGIPNNSNCLALFYNKDMFDQAGATPPTNWDELKSVAAKMTRNGVYGLSMALVKSEEGAFQFLPFLWEANADLDKLDSPEATTALNFLVDMVKAKSLSSESLNWTQQDAITQFIAQKAAMCINGPWQFPGLQKDAKFNWQVVPLPKGAQQASILGGENWAVTASSKNIKEAVDFILWTQQPDRLESVMEKDQNIPSRKDVAANDFWKKDPKLAVFVTSLATAKPRAYGPNYPKISDAVQQAFQAAISGQKSAADALKQAAATVKPLLSA